MSGARAAVQAQHDARQDPAAGSGGRGTPRGLRARRGRVDHGRLHPHGRRVPGGQRGHPVRPLLSPLACHPGRPPGQPKRRTSKARPWPAARRAPSSSTTARPGTGTRRIPRASPGARSRAPTSGGTPDRHRTRRAACARDARPHRHARPISPDGLTDVDHVAPFPVTSRTYSSITALFLEASQPRRCLRGAVSMSATRRSGWSRRADGAPRRRDRRSRTTRGTPGSRCAPRRRRG